MKNVFEDKNCLPETIQVHAKTPHIRLIKNEIKMRSEKYFILIKFCSNPSSTPLGTYEFNMYLFKKNLIIRVLPITE